MMNFRNTSTLLIIFVIYVAISKQVGVQATRGSVLSEDSGNANQLETHSHIYAKAKDIMVYWFQRLPSRPSPPGLGH
ncbi:pamp-induced secreted peptide 1 [Quercus suber]|uniref:Pamp-induced secreted peptide 1 n=1 Tax=Quercus suber TaxID=58331 RepID=A0AAW0JHV4_QUESU